ncbi:Actin-related protein 10 [Caenorhabditis elegans]|uniref:Actin-related protein 10 n=1 Tax=Caenorhabditis elegans TaxID=6239 RepID=Q9GYR2_CAEEL|nr:Actin-related protein 10 [Caenorhabditis elegans]CCD67713.1 Actin-related protein 10 [Caenorhabditis elegans]|eukprot:NP_501314.2 Actin-Related Proteins [Caenorhabditis elegans]
MFRIGCAGEITPRHIIRTEYVDDEGKLITSDELLALNNRKTATKSTEYYEEILYKFLRIVFLKVLAPTDRPVIFVESIFMSESLRNTITKIVVEKIRCKSLMFMPSHVCATFPFNTQNALVVDIGHSECIAVPIIEGVTMLNEFESARSICGRQLERRVREQMEKYGQIAELNGERRAITENDWQDIDACKLIETLSLSLICLDKERAENWTKWEASEEGEKPDIETLCKERLFPNNGKIFVVPPVVFETSTEIFFNENLNPTSFDLSLPKLLHKLVSKCPIDLRKKLFPNILLTGGVSTIPGLMKRLEQEIQVIDEKNNSKIAVIVKFYQFSEIKNTPLFVSWLGASLLGSLRETIERKSLTLEEWKNGKLAADWTDIIVKSR